MNKPNSSFSFVLLFELRDRWPCPDECNVFRDRVQEDFRSFELNWRKHLKGDKSEERCEAKKSRTNHLERCPSSSRNLEMSRDFVQFDFPLERDFQHEGSVLLEMDHRAGDLVDSKTNGMKEEEEEEEAEEVT